MYHEEIVLDYLGDMQAIIDLITEKDDNYESFLDVLTQIIVVHNKNGEKAYLDTIFRSEWIYSLPSMVYWAALGYIAVLPREDGEIDEIVLKLSRKLMRVNRRLGQMILMKPYTEDDNTYLN
tara:strand:- start:731 stop:1096 length:366 start_codon:yes stop_codon:yes gene_type:complete